MRLLHLRFKGPQKILNNPLYKKTKLQVNRALSRVLQLRNHPRIQKNNRELWSDARTRTSTGENFLG